MTLRMTAMTIMLAMPSKNSMGYGKSNEDGADNCDGNDHGNSDENEEYNWQWS